MLENVEKHGNQHIVSWLEHGRGFKVYRPKAFMQKIVPCYFNQSKYKSFQRQLHLYGFTRTTRGLEAGAYSHPKFVRGIKTLCLSMTPTKIKGKFSQAKQNDAADNIIVSTEGAFEMIEDKSYILPFPTLLQPSTVVSEQEQIITSDVNQENTGRTTNFKMPEWLTELDNFLENGPLLPPARNVVSPIPGRDEEIQPKTSEEDQGKEVGAMDKPPPSDGDLIFIFGDMPFHYLEKLPDIRIAKQA